MQKHITVVGALHIGYAALGILGALVVFMILSAVGLVTIAEDNSATAILTAIGCMIPGFLVVFFVPGIIGGIGVLRQKPWGRYMVLVVSVLALFSFPLGTGLGVYSIWVLMQDETAQLFGQGSGL